MAIALDYEPVTISAPRSDRTVSISMGDNDVNGCVTLLSLRACVSRVLSTIKANTEPLAAYRERPGASDSILAITRADVDVVNWPLWPNGKVRAKNKNKNKNWIAEFHNSVNPTLAPACLTSSVRLVDIAAALGRASRGRD